MNDVGCVKAIRNGRVWPSQRNTNRREDRENRENRRDGGLGEFEIF